MALLAKGNGFFLQILNILGGNIFIIKRVNIFDDSNWDSFVEKSVNGTIYHTLMWARAIVKTFKYEPLYLAMVDRYSSHYHGVIPLFKVKSILTGKRIVSVPFASYCNPLIDDGIFEVELIKILKTEDKYKHAQIRLVDRNTDQYNSFKFTSMYMTHILDLNADLESIFYKFHSTSVRQRIKKAERTGLSVKYLPIDKSLDIFYSIHTKTRKKHGLPPLPAKFFMNLAEFLGEANIKFPLVELNQQIIAAGLLLFFGGTCHLEYSGNIPGTERKNPAQILIWEAIKSAKDSGATKFDFGRTETEHLSLARFKDRWGAERRPLFYGSFPPEGFTHNNRAQKKAILQYINMHMPESLLRLQGSLLFRHLG